MHDFWSRVEEHNRQLVLDATTGAGNAIRGKHERRRRSRRTDLQRAKGETLDIWVANTERVLPRIDNAAQSSLELDNVGQLIGGLTARVLRLRLQQLYPFLKGGIKEAAILNLLLSQLPSQKQLK